MKTFGGKASEIIYEYDRNSEFVISLNVVPEREDTFLQTFDYEDVQEEMRQREASEEVLMDAFSLEGNLACSICRVHLESTKQQFFEYNELVYRRVLYVVGSMWCRNG